MSLLETPAYGEPLAELPQALVEITTEPLDESKYWGLAAIVFGSTLALYAAIGCAIYLVAF